MKNFKLILLLICSFLSINFAHAVQGTVEYNEINIDYDILDYKYFSELGDTYLSRAEKPGTTEEQKKFYYGEAIGLFVTATKINPDLVDVYGKIGYIYGKYRKYGLADSYLNRGLNMNPKDPTVNFYFGGVSFDRQNFNNALKYYKVAYKYGYPDKYSVTYRLGETNEKLGDLVKAEDFYKKALKIRPDNEKLKQKIRSIEDLKYKNSQYYYRKKPFYYND